MDFYAKLVTEGIEGDDYAMDLKQDARAITFQANLSAHNPTACTIRISGSLDNVGFKSFATHELSDEEIAEGFAIFHLINKPSLHYRVEVIILTGDVDQTVDVFWGGAYV